MAGNQPQAAHDAPNGTPGGTETAPGCGAVFQAVLLGAFVFIGWTTLYTYCFRPFYTYPPGGFAGAYIPHVELLKESSGVVIAALTGLLVAAGHRWRVAVPLLVLVPGGALFFEQVGANLGKSGSVTGWWWGPVYGAVAGAIVVATLRPTTRRWTHVALIGAVTLLALAGVFAASAWGRWYLGRLQSNVLPRVEGFIATSIRPDVGPVTWRDPTWERWGRRQLVEVSGTAAGSGLKIHVSTPLRLVGPQGARMPPGGSRVGVSFRHGVQERPQGEDLRQWLRWAGFKPELVSALTADRWGGLRATHNGVLYSCSGRSTIVSLTARPASGW